MILLRLGGDELVIIIDEVSHDDEIKTIAMKMLNNLNLPIGVEGNSYQLSGSIGISKFPKDADNIKCLLRHADKAMYQAKETGKNQFCFSSFELKKT